MMAENKKKKRQKKRHKPYPPLSKKDKAIYTGIDVLGAFLLLASVFGYEILAPVFVFKSSDILAFQERGTIFLLIPFALTLLLLLCDSTRKKIPIFGNKNVDYYNTSTHRFTMPLFDERYKNINNYQRQRKKIFKKIAVYSLVLVILLCAGLLGCLGRHEFDNNGITTYSVFNKPIEKYDYNNVESYTVKALRSIHRRNRGLGYTTYELNLTITIYGGKTFNANYDFARDIYAMKELDSLLAGKPKKVDDSCLREFIDSHNLSEDELKVLYELFEK